MSATGDQTGAVTWRPLNTTFVPAEQFGADHWSTFAYLETRTVDYRGTIAHHQMRCDERRHPVMEALKGGMARGGSSGGWRYPTLLAGGQEKPDHDDYDCIDDLVAAGLIEVHMPRPVLTPGDERFVDAYGKTIYNAAGDQIDPRFVTSYAELWLCGHATVSLTDLGRQVAAELRAHRAAGNTLATFRWDGAA
jgi:hypothetical protein